MVPVDLHCEGKITLTQWTALCWERIKLKIALCGPNIDNLQIYKSNEMSTARGPPMLPPQQAHTPRAIEITSFLPWSLSQ